MCGVFKHHSFVLKMKDKILIVGGYGAVGSIIAEQLAVHFPDRIIVAGRNLDKAKQLAAKLNNAVIPYFLDIHNFSDTALLNNVSLVIMCIDQANLHFIKACIAHRINYIDITANQELIENIETLHQDARENNSSVILSVGLAPGITNLLAQHSLNTNKDITAIDIFILLGLGEKHGDHAYQWTFDNFNTNYHIVLNGSKTRVKSFTQAQQAQLEGKRSFYLFNFSDQHSLQKTTSVREVITRMAFDSKFLTGVIAIGRKLGFTSIFKNKKLQGTLIKLFKNFSYGSDVYGAKVVGKTNDNTKAEYSVRGNGEGKVTAYVATEMALYCLNNPVKSGVWHSHQVIDDIPAFLNQLKKYDKNIATNVL